MLKRRRSRLLLLGILIAIGLVAAWIGLSMQIERKANEVSPMDVEWADGFAYASVAEGSIFRLSVNGDEVEVETLADGLEYPRGIAVASSTLFVVELGDLPCDDATPRCKGEHVGPTLVEGERTILETSAGRILAFPIEGESLGAPEVLLSGLSFVNADHGLNDLDLGPDGKLYLSVGNLDRLAWADVTDPPAGPETEHIGAVLRIDPTTGEMETFATGLRNVFGLTFDADGSLWGVDNDGPGQGTWRFEELLEIREGLDYGFPDEGTVGPYERRTGFATWIMPVGAGSGGILVEDDTVTSGGCGIVSRVNLVTDSGDADVDQADYAGCLTVIEPLPDDRLLLGTVFGPEPFRVVARDALFGE